MQGKESGGLGVGDLEHLPMALRYLREQSNLSQEAAVRAIREKSGMRVSAPMISQWERGRKCPSVGSLFGFLSALGCGLRELENALHSVRDPRQRPEIDMSFGRSTMLSPSRSERRWKEPPRGCLGIDETTKREKVTRWDRNPTTTT